MDDIDQETLEKLKEYFKDSDPNRSPSRKELLDMLEAVELSDEAKEKLKAIFTADVPKVFGTNSAGTLLALVFVFLVFSVIVFFGYKLYKSLKDKEKKREEKKKVKQMKKKK